MGAAARRGAQLRDLVDDGVDPLQPRLDLLKRHVAALAVEDPAPIEPERGILGLQQELHHLWVQEVGGELPVSAVDGEGAVEVLGLQLDVGCW